MNALDLDRDMAVAALEDLIAQILTIVEAHPQEGQWLISIVLIIMATNSSSEAQADVIVIVVARVFPTMPEKDLQRLDSVRPPKEKEIIIDVEKRWKRHE
jgi:hypothetical protein